MNRQLNWLEAFEAILRTYKNVDFIWGETDCALFVCDCLQAIYGKDFAEIFRGRYRTEQEALKILKDFSKTGLLETINIIVSENGGRSIQIPYAGVGDITYGPNRNMGIVVGNSFAFMSPKGFVTLELDKADCIWTFR